MVEAGVKIWGTGIRNGIVALLQSRWTVKGCIVAEKQVKSRADVYVTMCSALRKEKMLQLR